jgi:tRNA (cytidine/uridine-2'-O-)-methyltransferase
MIHIVLYQPQIPQNAGNIIRTCVGFNAILHMIKPYGFVLSNSKFTRSALDYLKKIKLIEHIDYDDFISTISKRSLVYYITRYGRNLPEKIKKPFGKQNIYLIFGCETKGLPKKILNDNIKKTIRIPISENIRCLNLSNCVAILLYQIAIKNGYKNLAIFEPK